MKKIDVVIVAGTIIFSIGLLVTVFKYVSHEISGNVAKPQPRQVVGVNNNKSERMLQIDIVNNVPVFGINNSRKIPITEIPDVTTNRLITIFTAHAFGNMSKTEDEKKKYGELVFREVNLAIAELEKLIERENE